MACCARRDGFHTALGFQEIPEPIINAGELVPLELVPLELVHWNWSHWNWSHWNWSIRTGPIVFCYMKTMKGSTQKVEIEKYK